MVRRKFKNIKNVHALVSKAPLAACLSLLMLSGCQSTSSSKSEPVIPAWITQTPSAPNIVYGVGQAQNYGDLQQAKNTAIESARVALAKQLNVVITADTRIVQQASNGTSKFKLNELIRSQVPDLKLQGLRISEEFQQGNTIYALAEFNKTNAIMQTELEISGVDNQISGVSLTQPTKTQRLKSALRVKKLLAERIQKNEFLSMLQSQQVLLSESVFYKVKQAEEVIAGLSFNLEVTSEKESNLRDHLAKALTDQGLKVSTFKPDFTIKIRTDWQNINQDSTHYSVAQTFVSIVENGEERAHFNSKVKAASSYQSMAKNKAMDKIADNLAEQIAEFISSSYM
ncbi:LPP20 family lipoprotein [Pseudoalteromonas phenolica]|uniref:LPP20 lipoprotein n=1 Tax=Pseudoalteromonas phenolica TaxID=161398 RepID=A0A0S2K333_9GAMM|nr:LPP20 family lipoprotein [Pseudoalteromonas phenolica]ALO42484.1 hypothetical protein PP2015_1986 [Pseudoalteromonas phenolica]RXE95324.1 hypothetical protein D9981_15785 [Pseudoalteromonas phenolica O-BC30]